MKKRTKQNQPLPEGRTIYRHYAHKYFTTGGAAMLDTYDRSTIIETTRVLTKVQAVEMLIKARPELAKYQVR